MNNNCVYFDFYSKRIGFYFNEKEKIGTLFGCFLSVLYILFSLALFENHIYYTIKRVNVKVYDSTVYSRDIIPYININPSLINFAFGLEDPLTKNRFIDETIYSPKIYFYEKTKIDGGYNITETKELEYEICQKANFGIDYENILDNNELNSSYCLKNYNISLTGGYNYNRMSYITINIYPCKNTTENNNTCKPQNVIDSYLNGGFISLLAKDIGLNPSNFSYPVIPSLKYLHTAVDKSIYKELNIYYSLTEINTDISFWYEKFKKEQYIQFSKEYATFYFRNEMDHLHNRSEIISINIRLEDKVNIQKRVYRKMNEVFFILGGYVQVLDILFTILTLASNSLNRELQILNGIFNFNLKEKKMTLRIHSIKDFNSLVFKKNLYFPSDKQITNLNTKIPYNSNNNVSKNNLIGCDNDNNSSQVNIFNRKHNSLVIIRESDKENEKNSSVKKQKKSNFSNNKPEKDCDNNNNNNISSNYNNNINNSNNNTNNQNQNQKKKKYIYRVGSFFPKLINNDKNQSNNSILKTFIDQIYFNIFNYYCFKKCSIKRKEIELYDSGLSLYRKRMDIVNVFTLLLFSEKNCLQAEEFYF